jgi:hypothetical protein
VKIHTSLIGSEAYHVGYPWLFASQQPAPERRSAGYIAASDAGLKCLAPNSDEPLRWFDQAAIGLNLAKASFCLTWT